MAQKILSLPKLGTKQTGPPPFLAADQVLLHMSPLRKKRPTRSLRPSAVVILCESAVRGPGVLLPVGFSKVFQGFPFQEKPTRGLPMYFFAFSIKIDVD